MLAGDLSVRLDRGLLIGGLVLGFGRLVLCICYEALRFF